VKKSLQEKLASILSTTENSQAYVRWISSFVLRISQYLQSTWNELRVNFQIRLCMFQIWQQTSNNQQAWKRGNPTIKQREDKTTRKNWAAFMSAHFQRSKLPQAFLHCQHALNVAITSNVIHISSWFWFLSTCSTLNCYVSEHRSSNLAGISACFEPNDKICIHNTMLALHQQPYFVLHATRTDIDQHLNISSSENKPTILGWPILRLRGRLLLCPLTRR